jgi:peptidoglycan/xylan/chitin deacetylase (PgdA/CDA1 family)
LVVVLMVVLAGLAWAQQGVPAREVAITFDDLPLGGPEIPLERMRAMTAALLETLKRHQVQAVGLVNENRLYRGGEMDERVAILRSWLDAGQELGNHTFSHPSFQETPLAAYQEDVIRGETVTRQLLAEKGMKMRYFRHPFLRTGPDLQTRAAFEKFLAERGYVVAPVTVENADYVFNAIYTRAKTAGDREAMRLAGEEYARFTETAFGFWEDVAQQLLGRPMRHVLLLHANELNAEQLDRLLQMMKGRGYRFVTLERALQDEAYRLPDKHVGRMGASWLYRWATAKGVKIDWRREPEPPAEILRRYNEIQAR